MKISKALYLSAKGHAEDLGQSGDAGMIGSDGSFPEERISEHCTIGGGYAESLRTGVGYTAKEIIEHLLVDDGLV